CPTCIHAMPHLLPQSIHMVSPHGLVWLCDSSIRQVYYKTTLNTSAEEEILYLSQPANNRLKGSRRDREKFKVSFEKVTILEQFVLASFHAMPFSKNSHQF
ncbi:unnamed protein product, partial [Owenia fusiformis]